MNLTILLFFVIQLMFFLIVLLIVALTLVNQIFKRVKHSKGNKIKLLIILGSGGHTTEMLQLIKSIDLVNKYEALFIISEGDKHSEKKLKENDKTSEIMKVTRSRKVGQNYFTSILTTTICLIQSFFICLKYKPKLILCNGPGTCIPFCLVGKLICSKTVFVESFCRTKSLSLSGKIATRLCDHVLVQWPELEDENKNTKYIGFLL